MANEQHIYFLMTKPAALTMPEWSTVLSALAGIIGRANTAPNPVYHLQSRLSLDTMQIIVEGVFDPADLDPADVTHLCKYISDALGGKYTPAQIRTGLQNNVTVWSGTHAESGDQARAYMAANRTSWEAPAP